MQKMKIVGQSITINVVWTINPLYSNFQAFLWIQKWPFIKSNRMLVRFFQKKLFSSHYYSFYLLINIPGEVLLKGKNFEKHTVFWLLQKTRLVRITWWLLFQKNIFWWLMLEAFLLFGMSNDNQLDSKSFLISFTWYAYFDGALFHWVCSKQ